jgi:hypothetical protein
MSEAQPPQDAAAALQAALAAMRRDGAWRIDPARFHWLEALSRRLPAQSEPVRRILQARLEAAVADYALRLAAAPPPAANVRGLHAVAAPLPAAAGGGPLVQLNRAIRSARPADAAALPGESQQPDELASVRRFRRAWSASRSQQQVAQAALRKPANPGPLNSHALVLDSLELMRELSPDYLRRFLLHVESLQWLEQAREQAAPQRAAPAGKARAAKPAAPARRGSGKKQRD